MKSDSKNNYLNKNISLEHTPIIKMLSSYLEKETVSFHMPGHTNGKSFSKWLHKNALSIDTTELESTDDLHNPTNSIKDATLLAAKAFGSAETFFVTTGSTTAIYAALLGVTVPGDEVIMFRNVHKSVLNACIMFDLVPVFTTETDLAKTINNHNGAVAVFLTRPDYYGRCIDIVNISKLVHKTNMILIIDEAHGTHFAFCPSHLPVPAVSNGADVVIQSAHKTAPALTQAAYMHISHEAVVSKRIMPAKINESLTMISTSSPSFLIAATLDFARAFLQENGDAASKALFANIEYFYKLLSVEWLPCFEHPSEKEGNITFDPFRIVISTKSMPFTAGEVAKELHDNGIFIEFFDLSKVVLICKFDNTKDDFILLANVLNTFLKKRLNEKENCNFLKIKQLETLEKKLHEITTCFPARVYLPHCGITEKNNIESIPLKDAAQHVLFSAIIPYPPGIAIIWPGEIISNETVILLEGLLENKYSIYGIDNYSDKETGETIPHVHCIKEGFCRNK